MRDILIVLFIDDIDDIIDGNDTQNRTLTGDDRNRLQIVFGYNLGNLLLVYFRFYGNDLIVHDFIQLFISR